MVSPRCVSCLRALLLGYYAAWFIGAVVMMATDNSNSFHPIQMILPAVTFMAPILIGVVLNIVVTFMAPLLVDDEDEKLGVHEGREDIELGVHEGMEDIELMQLPLLPAAATTSSTTPTSDIFKWNTPRPFSYEELAAATNFFSDSNRLGRGAQATVFQGQSLDGRTIAVKRLIHVQDNSADELEAFRREVHALSATRHNNVVELYGYCIHGQHRMLVYELASNGSLHDWLFVPNLPPRHTLSWYERLVIARDAARGLTYLHHHSLCNLLHLDIKPHNILLDDHLHAKIADFGLSKLIDPSQSRLRDAPIGGTPGYLSPECAAGNGVTPKADVYSFGIVLLQLVSGKRLNDPVDGRSLREAAGYLVERGEEATLLDESLGNDKESNHVGAEMVKVGAQCVKLAEEDRPSMAHVYRLLDNICEPSRKTLIKLGKRAVLVR